jgi:hypothetical protein
MMSNRSVSRLFLRISLSLLISATPLWAGGPSIEELRKEAFLRGGQAIAVALNTKTEPVVTAGKVVTEVTPVPTAPLLVPPQAREKGMSKFAWVGLVAGFAVTGALVYHFAAGPGASVRNCSTCK